MAEPEAPSRLQLLVLAPAGADVLVTAGGELPGVEAPGRLQESAEVARAAREALGAEVGLLRIVDEPEPSGRQRVVAVLALRGEPPARTRWGAAPAEFGPVLAEATGPRPPKQPWRHRDWLPAAEAWLLGAVREAGRAATGPVEQVRVWDLSCVLRVPTDGGRVYLKATVTAPLFADEVSVTPALARLFPGRVPAPLAADRERALLALEDAGEEIGWEASPEDWEGLVREFGRLQLASVPYAAELRAAGCRDRSLEWLAGQLPVWFDAGLLGRFAPADVAGRLAAAVPRLVEVCAELASSGVPTALLHGDMHPGNVARGRDGYVYFDWTDTALGHPFLDVIAIDLAGADRDRLRDAYLAEWSGLVPPDRLRALWPLVEVLAPANQAVSYLSLGLFLGNGAPSSLFGSFTVHWLEKVLAALDRLR
ncbi:MAG TPA: aminoglycoside phosphotransferase family protein [Mycobacteriales bacterium]|nr:aminoglycoside phosphotransferase family protein [Mycobacteriales bacterium]